MRTSTLSHCSRAQSTTVYLLLFLTYSCLIVTNSLVQPLRFFSYVSQYAPQDRANFNRKTSTFRNEVKVSYSSRVSMVHTSSCFSSLIRTNTRIRRTITTSPSFSSSSSYKSRSAPPSTSSSSSPSSTSSFSSSASSSSSTALRCLSVDSTFDDADGDYSSEEVQTALDMALGEDFSKELNKKVEEAMQEEWDVKQGVNPSRVKPLPLQANLDLWSYSAKQQMLKGNFSGAEELYQRCIDYNPCDGRAWLGLGRIYWKRGQALRAEKIYKDGLYYNPNNPFILQSWAVMLEKIGKVPEATKLLTKSVKMNPSHAASWVALARIHQRHGQVDEARNCYTSAVEGDPHSYVALQAWGVLEADCGNVAGARNLFRRAEKCSSKSAHTLQAWATLEKRAGNLEEADRLLGKALKAFPDSTRVRLSYAELFELRGEPTKAREIFQRGEGKAKSCGDAGFFQSWALFELRQYPGRYSTPSPASPYSSTSASLSSSSSAARNRTAAIAAVEANAAGQVERERVTASEQVHAIARRLFKKAVTVNKYHSASWVAWAKHEQRAGNLDVARRLLITGISNFPHSKNIGWFHAALASLARQDGDLPTARACYGRAVQATPPQLSLQVLLDYAKMEAYLGDKVQAVKLFETAVKRFPTHDRSWNAYIDFAAYANSNSTNGRPLSDSSNSNSYSGSGGSVVGRVKELEDRQRVALKSAKREKTIINNRENLRESSSDEHSSDSVDQEHSSEDSDSELGYPSSFRFSDSDRAETGGGGGGNVKGMTDIMGVRSDKDDSGSSLSELDFISRYEKVVSGGDDCDGTEASEGGAIDRALRLLGLDGRRAPLPPQRSGQGEAQTPTQTQTQAIVTQTTPQTIGAQTIGAQTIGAQSAPGIAQDISQEKIEQSQSHTAR